MSLFLMFVLTSCGMQTPDKKRLEAILPTEVLQYELDGECFTSKVTDFEILGQQTNGKSDVADCKITLEDENLIRTAYIRLESSYWDQGGWMLDDYVVNAAEEFMPKAEIDKNRVLDVLNAHGYTDYDEVSYEESAGFSVGEYSINEEHRYLTVHGNVSAEAELVNNENMSYPTRYSWATVMDDSLLQTDWNIGGTWYGESYSESFFSNPNEEYKPSLRVTISFYDVIQNDDNSGEFSYNIKSAFDSVKGGEGSYDNVGTSSWECMGSGVSDMLLNLYVYDGYHSFTLAIYPDTAAISSLNSISGDFKDHKGATNIEKIDG